MSCYTVMIMGVVFLVVTSILTRESVTNITLGHDQRVTLCNQTKQYTLDCLKHYHKNDSSRCLVKTL